MTPDQIFDKAVEFVLKHEGGYVCNPVDPGGCTNFGISARSYPNLDIQRLTRVQAREIYRKDWWQKQGFWRILNVTLAIKVMDVAVNVGAKRAIGWLQDAAKKASGRPLLVDGILGLETEAVVNSADQVQTMGLFLAKAFVHYEKQGIKRPLFRTGWMNRLFDF